MANATTPSIEPLGVPASRVTFDGFERSRTSTADVAFQRFEGEAKPRPFRGEGLSDTVEMKALFLPTRRSSALALLNLFRAAHIAADNRFLLYLGGTYETTIQATMTGVVREWSDSIKPVANIIEITFAFIETA